MEAFDKQLHLTHRHIPDDPVYRVEHDRKDNADDRSKERGRDTSEHALDTAHRFLQGAEGYAADTGHQA